MSSEAEKKVEQLARRLARSLFTDGTGQRAKRLIFEFPGHDYIATGWSERALADHLEVKLRSALASRFTDHGSRITKGAAR